MANVRNLVLNLEARTIKMDQALSRMGDKLDQTNRHFNRFTNSIRTGFSNAAKSVAAFAVAMVSINAASRGFTWIVDVNRKFESLKASLETMTGSTEAALREFARLQKFAEKTPFSLEQSVRAFNTLLGLGLDASEETMTAFGNFASAKSKDMIQFIEAVADATTFEFERLKEFHVKSRQEADTVKFTFKGVTTEVEKNAEAIVQYLKNIGETNFAGAMEKQMARLPGKLSNLEDSFDKLAEAIGEGGFNGAVGRAAETLANFISEFIESGRARHMGEVIGAAIDVGTWAFTKFAEAISHAATGLNLFLAIASFGEKPTLAGGLRLANMAMPVKPPSTVNVPPIEDTISNIQKKKEPVITDQMKSLAESIKLTHDPQYQFAKQVQEIDKLLQANLISKEIYEKAYKDYAEQLVESNKRIFESTEEFKETEKITAAIIKEMQELESMRQHWLSVADSINSTYDPQYRFLQQLGEINFLRKENLISEKVYASAYRDFAEQFIESNKRMLMSTKDFAAGAKVAMMDYLDEVNNAAERSYEFFSRAFKGMEDLLTDFFTTGKLNFQDFADMVVREMNRIIVQQMIMRPLMDSMGLISSGVSGMFGGGLFGGGFFGGGNGSSGSLTTHGVSASGETFATAPRAIGGPVFAGSAYKVGEMGPEYFVPSTDGRIEPMADKPRQQPINVNMVVNATDANSFHASEDQIVKSLGRKLQHVSMRY